ncbi:MAG: hypothetical protein J5822_03090 [Eubacteriaceae bacterium]|nr:hypothetical protein [Eubacteriaceae bacterium]
MAQKDFLSERLEESARMASERMIRIYTDFYEPNLQHIIEREMGRYPASGCAFFGGHDFTERKMLCVHPRGEAPSERDFPIDCVQIPLPKKSGVSHRDVLGSVLALGVERDQTGEITVRDNLVQLFVARPIGQLIADELRQIGGVGVIPRIASPDEVKVYEPRFTPVSVIIPSMRIDALIHAVYRLSRNEAAAFVKGEKVFINHEVITKPGRDVKEGDIVSVRSKGRFVVEKVAGQTKKGNIKIDVKKFS